MSIHPYFTDKARAVFTAAGGDPDNADQLAEWAAALRAGPHWTPRTGVIVAEDGTILAETSHVPSTGWSTGGTYVARIMAELGDPDADGGHADLEGLVDLEVGLACGHLRRLAGQGVIHVTASQVCAGAGRQAKGLTSHGH